MHELAITRNIVAIAGEAARGRTVRRVTVEIGALSGVMSDAIAFCFPIVAERTLLADAELQIVLVSGRARCRECNVEFDTPSLLTPCPCGSRSIVRLQGEELKIRTLELDEVS